MTGMSDGSEPCAAPGAAESGTRDQVILPKVMDSLCPQSGPGLGDVAAPAASQDELRVCLYSKHTK